MDGQMDGQKLNNGRTKLDFSPRLLWGYKYHYTKNKCKNRHDTPPYKYHFVFGYTLLLYIAGKPQFTAFSGG